MNFEILYTIEDVEIIIITIYVDAETVEEVLFKECRMSLEISGGIYVR